MFRALAHLIVAFFVVGTSFAEDMVLVKDVNTNPRALRVYYRCTLNGAEYLFADDLIRGIELWAGDGLQGTSHLVKDIKPGSDSGIPGGNCVEMNGNLYFLADDGSHGYELWKSDGTAAGTVLVKDIKNGTGSGIPSWLTVLGNELLFSADDGTTGGELWKSDGTEAGTQLVKDIYSGAFGSGISYITKIDSTTVVFTANDGVSGSELWRSDGSSSGTVLVKDIYSGSTGSSIQDISLFGSSVFFGATTAANGSEPWVSDGTLGGTSMLKDISAGASNGYFSSFLGLSTIGGKIAFSARDNATGIEPWVTDGTPGGTVLLSDINPGASHSIAANFIAINGKFIFKANTAALGTEIYSTDGTPVGTALLSDVATGASSGTDLSSAHTLIDQSAVVFSGSANGSSYSRLYSTNGTSVTLLTDLYPGAPSVSVSDYFEPTSAGVQFGMPAPFSSMPEPGFIFTDGTVSGTGVHPGTLSGYTESASVIPLGQINSKLIFAADDGDHGYELWATDGTSGGTTRISDINTGIAWSILPSAGFAVVGNTLVFVATDATHGAELWSTDGSTVSLVEDIVPGPESSLFPSNSFAKFYTLGNRVLFSAYTAAEGNELWGYAPGETPAVYRIKNIKAGAASGMPDGGLRGAVISISGTDYLVFAADDGAFGVEMWVTDGTNDPTHCVISADIYPGANSSNPDYFVASPDKTGAVFSACNAAAGCEPWKTTGILTAIIKDVEVGASGSFPSEFVFLPQAPLTLFFMAHTNAAGYELWKSDLTAGGTTIVKDAIPGANSLVPTQLTVLNSTTILFRGYGDGNGGDNELWKSDGTPGGTVEVKDLDTTSASASGAPDGFGVLNGVAYFAASNGSSIYNRQYYRSDGTDAGTYALTSQGTAYFAASLLPRAFTPALSTLFFGAYSSSFGYELFKIGADECPSDASKTGAGICGCGVADSDADGDGAVDCQEECPSDALKQVAGSCGCGTADVDANGNGAADCIDAAAPTTTPARAKIKQKRNKALITMQVRSGVRYEIRYLVLSGSAKLSKKAKFRKKIVTTNTTTLKAPPKGSKLYVKYRYLVKSSTLTSKYSKVANRKFK